MWEGGYSTNLSYSFAMEDCNILSKQVYSELHTEHCSLDMQ